MKREVEVEVEVLPYSKLILISITLQKKESVKFKLEQKKDEKNTGLDPPSPNRGPEV